MTAAGEEVLLDLLRRVAEALEALVNNTGDAVVWMLGEDAEEDDHDDNPDGLPF